MSILDQEALEGATRLLPSGEASNRLWFAAAATEDVLAGSRLLRRAFLAAPIRTVERGMRIGSHDGSELEIFSITNGFAYRSCFLADGRRAIIDVLTSGDLIGLDHVVLARPLDEFTAASRLSFHPLPAGELRRLLADPQIALYFFTLLAEARWRTNRLAVSIGRLDAATRICLFLLDIHDRLHRRGLISRPTYNLPLTQEQIADHLGLTVVHVNRTLRRLREEKLALVDRQVVIIQDLEQLRRRVAGLTPPNGARSRSRRGGGPMKANCARSEKIS